MERLARWQKVGVTLVACLLTCTSDWSCAAPLAILMIGRNRGCFHKQMLWMMAIISLYAVAFFIFHSPTYGMVHLACWLTVPLLAMYNGQRAESKCKAQISIAYFEKDMKNKSHLKVTFKWSSVDQVLLPALSGVVKTFILTMQR